MKAKAMTPTARKKFLSSDECDAAFKLAYPYGYSEETEQEKIGLIYEIERTRKLEWDAILSAACGDGWNDSPAQLAEFNRACAAQENADDTAALEKVCAVGSPYYYGIALDTYEGSENED